MEVIFIINNLANLRKLEWREEQDRLRYGTWLHVHAGLHARSMHAHAGLWRR